MRPQSMQQTLLQIAPANALALSLSFTHTHTLTHAISLNFIVCTSAVCQSSVRAAFWALPGLLCAAFPPCRPTPSFMYFSAWLYVCVCEYVFLCFFIACCQAQQHIGLPLKNIRSHFSDSFHKIVQNVFLYFYFSFFLGQLLFYIFSMFCCLHLGFLGRGIYISWRISFNTLRLRPRKCVSIGTAVNLKACVDKKIKWNNPFNLFAVGSVISI